VQRPGKSFRDRQAHDVSNLLQVRPVVMFDEWAADQDPEFRSVFYRELLPELQREGKTLIVVSHDDRYFDVADRVIRMSAGRIAEEVKPSGKRLYRSSRYSTRHAVTGALR